MSLKMEALLNSVKGHLTELGFEVRVDPGEPGFLLLSDQAANEWRFAHRECRSNLGPARIRALLETLHTPDGSPAPLLLCRYVSPRAGRALTSAGCSWIDTLGNVDIRARGLRVVQRVSAKPERRVRRLPAGEESRRAIRWMIAHGDVEEWRAGAITQAGISSPRVTQLMRALQGLGLAERVGWGRWRIDHDALLHRFLDEYEGPSGDEVHWYTLDPVSEIALEIATRHGPTIAISADVGPDSIAPWRVPTNLVVYATESLDLSAMGLVRADSRAAGNVHVRYPEDRTVFPPVELEQVRGTTVMNLADPTQMLWDLLDLGGTERGEAADHLTAWMRGAK
jgi:hypothetical protein